MFTGNQLTIDCSAFQECSALVTRDEDRGISLTGTGITEIRDYTFYECKSLTDFSALVPNTVSSIGNSAFSGCPYLTSIVMPSSMKSIGDAVFSPSEDGSINDIRHLGLNNGLEHIGLGAFDTSLQLSGQIVIPNTVTSIGDYAFAYCSHINAVKLSENLSAISESLFSNC